MGIHERDYYRDSSSRWGSADGGRGAGAGGRRAGGRRRDGLAGGPAAISANGAGGTTNTNKGDAVNGLPYRVKPFLSVSTVTV